MYLALCLAFLSALTIHTSSAANIRSNLDRLERLRHGRSHNMSMSDHNRFRLQRISEIRNTVLEQLNRTDTPRVSVEIFTDAETNEMMRHYEKTLNESEASIGDGEEADDVDMMKSVHVLTATCDPPRDMDPVSWNESSSLRMYFDLTRYSPDRYQIMSATLTLHKRASYPPVTPEPTQSGKENGEKGDNDYSKTSQEEISNYTDARSRFDQKLNITVYQLRYNRQNTPTLRRKHIETKTVAVNFEGWINFSVAHAVRKWVESPGKNDGVEVVVEFVEDDEFIEQVGATVDGCGDNDTAAEYEPPTISEMYQRFYPILNLVARQGVITFPGRIRGRRSNPLKKNVSRRAGNSRKSVRCSASPLHVSFKELGMDDWILKPDSFKTYVCSGSCVSGDVTTNHHGVSRAFRKHHGFHGSQQKKYCCGPTRTKPLVILYICSDGHLCVEKVNGVINERCDYIA